MVKEIVHILIEFTIWFIIIGTLLTWIPPRSRNTTVWKIIDLTEKFLRPIRSFVPPIGGIDISPIVAIIVLQIIDSIIRRL
ncbi:YggT family protein [Desulfurobacterium thermolithotrophum]|uniref:YggT family protein n=1 Tax=Desulfurobacterium thermolithotrophum TaxID=64160 RepID=UPI0013D04E2A|nr:YggT family protein [Desulfurobacterium thermolithotrophum]